MATKPKPPKPTGFRSFPHTADAGFILWGETLGDLFIQGAQALMSLMTDRRRVRRRQEVLTSLEAPDREALLVEWLNHLLYLFDTKSFLVREVTILELVDNRLQARLQGEELDLERHPVKTGVKAATYHQLAIRRQPGGWEATVIFDL